jgi:FAD/FMN-containing dehydrogenase
MKIEKKDFVRFIEKDRILDDPENCAEFGRDRTKIHKPDPSLILFPKTVEEIQKVVRYCSDQGIAIVPSGGRTGYAAAAVAANKEVVISMNKMDRILNIDIESGSVAMEAGAILENVQKAVVEQGMYFPLDFAARGSCQIGGCLSTNAGGLKVIKYGMTRELALGLEVVTPTGEILNLNSNLHKNNSGYDLKHFFIGAEGTLGLITKATMKIVPPPQNLRVTLLAVRSFTEILNVLKLAKLSALDITAFEFFTRPCLDAVLSHIPSLRDPFSEMYPFYLVLEIDDATGTLDNFLERLIDAGAIANGISASGAKEFRDVWSLRESISESLSMLGQVHKNDIAVPVSSMPSFVNALEKLIAEKYTGFEVLLFGHIGDGNIHVNAIDRNGMAAEAFQEATERLDMDMCTLIKNFSGSISAEHGIGLLKKKLLHLQRSREEIALMRKVKAALDPKNICNPGKIL